MTDPEPDSARGGAHPTDAPAEERVLAVLAELVAELRRGAPTAPVRLDARLERDLGLDSLARMELVGRLEQAFGRRIAEEQATRAETPRDLLRALRTEAPAGPEPWAREGAAAPPVPTESRGVPEEASTLFEMLAWHARNQGERVHLTLLEGEAGERRLTYGELYDRALGTAAGLRARGVEPGDPVAIMLPTGMAFFETFFGALAAGAVPVPLYPPARPSQLADHLERQVGILGNCLAPVLVTVPEARPFARALRARLEALRAVLTPEDLLGQAHGAEPVRVDAADIALLQYTSGSTGQPKGVILSHAHLLANIRAMGRAAGVGSRDVFVSWLPLYHDMGLIGAWLGSLYWGMTLVVMSPLAFLSRPVRWLRTITRFRATVSAAPNFAYELCATRIPEADLEGLDLSSLRWAFNGAEPVSAATMRKFAARFAARGFDPRAIAPVYGLAECALDLVFPPPLRGLQVDVVDRDTLTREGRARQVAAEAAGALELVACGRPLPGYEVRIADDAGRELPERREGRIEFQGPSATPGYYRNREASARLFDGPWLDTGDLGYVAEGELVITGRAKDVMIRGGHNLYPYALEEAVGALPGVRKGCVCVFGVPDPAAGTERIVVVAETRETQAQPLAALRARINDLAVTLLGGPADDVVLAPPHSVLKTSSGKIRRAASRDLYIGGNIGAGRPTAWRQTLGIVMAGVSGGMRRALRGARERLWGLWAWAILGVFALGAAAVSWLPDTGWRRGALRACARGALRLSALPVRLEGLERLQGADPMVVVANHASYVDALVLYAILPPRFGFVAKQELTRHASVARLLRAAGARFVERFDPGRGIEDARELTRAAQAGEPLVFFPEGTFRRNPGLRPFRMGAFVAAACSGLPVVPVALRGTRSVLRAGEWMPRREPVEVRVGPSLRPRGEDWGAAVALRDEARSWMLPACGEPDLEAEALEQAPPA